MNAGRKKSDEADEEPGASAASDPASEAPVPSVEATPELPEACDVVIVGAGPAGLATALAASGSPLDIVVIDERPGPTERPGVNTIAPRGLAWLADYGIALDAVLARPARCEEVRLHLPDHGSWTRRPAEPVTRVSLSALEAAIEDLVEFPVHRRSRLLSAEPAEDGLNLRVKTPRGPKTLHTRRLVDASGRETLGPPRTHPEWRPDVMRLGPPRFVGRVRLEVHDDQAPAVEMRFERFCRAFFVSGEGQLVVELELSSDRLWASRWSEFLRFLTGPRGLRVKRESGATFVWQRRPQLQLVADRVVRVGDAAGAGPVLGFGLAEALETGTALGDRLAPATLDVLEDQVQDYDREARELLAHVIEEHGRGARRRLDYGGFADRIRLSDLFEDAGFFARWGARRACRSALSDWWL